jgi:hypothetical protein
MLVLIDPVSSITLPVGIRYPFSSQLPRDCVYRAYYALDERRGLFAPEVSWHAEYNTSDH